MGKAGDWGLTIVDGRGTIEFCKVVILGVCLSTSVWAVNGDMGIETEPLTNGSEAYPWLIEDLADFDAFAGNSAYWGTGVHTKLMTDIDLSGRTYTRAVIAPDTDNTNLYAEFQGKKFSGVLDGNNRTISNLTIASSRDYVGLFGSIESAGHIKNLGVTNGNIGGFQYVGGLTGENQGTVTSCSSTSLVNGTATVGGLAGSNSGIVTACYATGSVSGAGNVGGLVGDNTLGTLNSCYASGSVSGDDYVGGLAGATYCGTLTYCYSTGSVSGTTEYVGGLVSYNSSDTLNSCFWDMETSGQTDSGRGKGLTTEQMKTLSIYQNAGWSDKGWVMNDGLDYPRLAWEDTTGVPIPQPQAVPLLGSGCEQDPYQVWTVDDFILLSWHVELLSKHITLKTDLDFSGVILCPVGDLGPFTGIFDGNNNLISNVVINRPNNSDVGLFGVVGSDGQIRNLSMEDINITGHFNVGCIAGRNGGLITSCYATGSVNGTYSTGGLVGSSQGTLSSCQADVSVSGIGGVGGLVGGNDGTLTLCYAAGSVNGTSTVGGLAGSNDGRINIGYATGSVAGIDTVGGLVGLNWGALTSCYATGKVSGTFYDFGGLVGYNDYSGTLDSCYATGSVSGADHVGGLVGSNDGTITACYAIGTVSGECYIGGVIGWGRSVTNCFWDAERSEIGGSGDNSLGAIGKTTAQMMNQNTFIDWDFTSPVWKMLREGEDYPRLAWQEVFAGDVAGLYGVDVVDLMEIARNWLKACSGDCEDADIDESGVVDLADFAIVAGSWMGM